MKNPDKSEVPADIYDRDYYMTDNEGCREYAAGLDEHIHPKFKRALEIAPALAGQNILDIGCGRGELLYYCSKNGARSLGLDYSQAAIEIAHETIRRLPKELQPLARAEQADVSSYPFTDKFDTVFMLEIVEHLTEPQIRSTLNKINKILKPSGKLIITTPNIYYEKYLCPLKRTLDIPFKFLKEFFRVLRGKYKPRNFNEFARKVLRIIPDRGEKNKMMHCNVVTPARLKALLSDFDATVVCEDPSIAPVSLLLAKWWGRGIVAVARKRSA